MIAFILTLILPLALCASTSWRHLGNHSLEMFEELEEGILEDYQIDRKTLVHFDQEFNIVTGEMNQFSRIPTVFIGSYPMGREIILLNPQDAPLLDTFYQNFVDSLTPALSHFEVLEKLSDFINEHVFIPELSNESQLNAFINQWCFDRDRCREDYSITISTYYIPVIPLEKFISLGVGVCRHYALATAYFLDRLAQEGYIHGKAFVVRDIVSSRISMGGHAWNLFISDEGKEVWHLDTYWEELQNCNQPEEMRILCERYGSNAIENQLVRFLETVHKPGF